MINEPKLMQKSVFNCAVKEEMFQMPTTITFAFL
jgi:hypothetical protein